MATIYLPMIWVNRMDTGEGVSGYTTLDRTRSSHIVGETRTYAGGRQRSISSRGNKGEFAFQMEELTDPEVKTLEDWKGIVVQVRDHRGQRFVGTYYEVKIAERRWTHNGAVNKAMAGYPMYRAAITLMTVTVVEGV